MQEGQVDPNFNLSGVNREALVELPWLQMYVATVELVQLRTPFGKVHTRRQEEAQRSF